MGWQLPVLQNTLQRCSGLASLLSEVNPLSRLTLKCSGVLSEGRSVVIWRVTVDVLVGNQLLSQLSALAFWDSRQIICHLLTVNLNPASPCVGSGNSSSHRMVSTTSRDFLWTYEVNILADASLLNGVVDVLIVLAQRNLWRRSVGCLVASVEGVELISFKFSETFFAVPDLLGKLVHPSLLSFG
jgi:hypothetical protein